jgi:hypothetical protein
MLYLLKIHLRLLLIICYVPTLVYLYIKAIVILVQLALGSKPSYNALSYLPLAH